MHRRLKVSVLSMGAIAVITAIAFYFISDVRIIAAKKLGIESRAPTSVATLPQSDVKNFPNVRINSIVDSFLKRMTLGSIAFNVPERMNRHDITTIQLLLSPTQSQDELKKEIFHTGFKEGATILVSDRMEARLTGTNFSITSTTPDTQAISQLTTTEWKWEIKPLAEGPQSLHLTISVLIDFDGKSTHRAIRTFYKKIDVEVTSYQRAIFFIEENWQWLWTVILVPVIGWLWKRRKVIQNN